MSEVIVIRGIETKQVPDYPNYSASRCGKIFRISSTLEMRQYKLGRQDYWLTRTCHNNVAKTPRVHILVASAWISNPDPLTRTFINHKDGNGFNNNVDNLEWVTPAENLRHAYQTGLMGRGDELYNSELTDQDVHEICRHLIDGWRAKDLSDKYGVSVDIIRKIKTGSTYFHVRQLYDIPHTFQNEFSESTVRWVCERINEGMADLIIAKNSTNDKLTTIEIKRIRHKIRYKYISDEYF